MEIKNVCTRRPITQLFMLQSLDGKISTGSTDEFDVDQDFPNLPATKAGLHRYYELEQETDLWSLGTGKTMAKKAGPNVNEKTYNGEKIVNFVMIDNRHLTKQGVEYFCAKSPKFVLVTTNGNHPAFSVQANNIQIIKQETLNLPEMMEKLYDLGCRNLTVQTGGTINAMMLREHLIDRVNVVIAPAFVGGTNTPSIIGGPSLADHSQIGSITGLQLIKLENLGKSYIHVIYEVMK